MARQLFPEWRQQHDGTKYPFGDAASLVNSEGYMLLEGTLLDAVLYPVGGGDGIHLAKVTITSDTVTLTIGDRLRKELATASFPLLDPPAEVALTDTYGRPAGLLVSEPQRLGVFQSWAVGDHLFKQAESEFAATVCFPTPEAGLRGVLLDDGTLLTGDVWLVGDDGVVLREEHDLVGIGCDGSCHVIRVDVVGDPLFRRRLCESDDLFTTPRFIKTVRVLHTDGEFVVVPDAKGNIQISVGTGLASDVALRIRTSSSGVGIGVVGQSS